MFIFHEGQPGSGKSYESLVKWIIPTVAKGDRKVFAYVEDLDHDKIADLAGVTRDECKERLIQLSADDVKDVYNKIEDNCVLVIDEMQNFFPSTRGNLDEAMTKFVAEHRHQGIDIIGMGQSIADIHRLWKRRCQRKISFLKMDMMGMDNRFKWTMYQGQMDNKGEARFVKVRSGQDKYDPKYFGSYASHSNDDVQTGNLTDDRVIVWKTPGFKYGIPAFLVVIGFAIYTLADTMSSGFVDDELLNSTEEQDGQSLQESAMTTVQNIVVPAKPEKITARDAMDSYVESISEGDKKLHYGGRITTGQRSDYLVHVVNADTGFVEQTLKTDQIQTLGYNVIEMSESAVMLVNSRNAIYVTTLNFEQLYPDTFDAPIDNPFETIE